MEQHAATTPGAHSGQRATIAAFLANLGIAAAKFVAFAVTGAASMLAEGVHSVADTGNQGLLLWGRRRANQEPNEQHPFGFGRERYFWAFVVALVLFSAGGIFALVEGEEKLALFARRVVKSGQRMQEILDRTGPDAHATFRFTPVRLRLQGVLGGEENFRYRDF